MCTGNPLEIFLCAHATIISEPAVDSVKRDGIANSICRIVLAFVIKLGYNPVVLCPYLAKAFC